MGLTSALFTGLSGLNSAQFRLDTIGDNIANVNTTGFKGTRSMFQTQFARTLSAGTGPSGSQGGTNPMQLGLGSVLGSVQRLFSAGSIVPGTRHDSVPHRISSPPRRGGGWPRRRGE